MVPQVLHNFILQIWNKYSILVFCALNYHYEKKSILQHNLLYIKNHVIKTLTLTHLIKRYFFNNYWLKKLHLII